MPKTTDNYRNQDGCHNCGDATIGPCCLNREPRPLRSAFLDDFDWQASCESWTEDSAVSLVGICNAYTKRE